MGLVSVSWLRYVRCRWNYVKASRCLDCCFAFDSSTSLTPMRARARASETHTIIDTLQQQQQQRSQYDLDEDRNLRARAGMSAALEAQIAAFGACTHAHDKLCSVTQKRPDSATCFVCFSACLFSCSKHSHTHTDTD